MWMDTAAADARANHFKVRTSHEKLAATLERLIDIHDEPFASTSMFVQHEVFGLAKLNGIKVMLDGQGADELFAGYMGYTEKRLETLIRKGAWLEALLFTFGAKPPQSALKMLSHAVYGMLPSHLTLLAKKVAGRGRALAGVNLSWFKDNLGYQEYSAKVEGSNRLRANLWRAISVSSLPMLLRYEDRNSMAHSIESRVPFLTAPMAEFALSIPEELLLGDQGRSKEIVRQGARGLAPDTILDRKDKIGFATPEAMWLQYLKPWVDEQLSDENLARFPFLKAQVIREQWHSFTTRKTAFESSFWRWINLSAWSRQKNIIFIK
jgi:asparagine synthase (glutamine-hydrolysing)